MGFVGVGRLRDTDAMSESEFDQVAVLTAQTLHGADFLDRVSGACRGSGNPAALAWLADGLRLDESTRVIDLGAGLGGPAAWIARRYGCRIVAMDPAHGAATGCHLLFDTPVVRAVASHAPFAADAFDVGLILGVLSVLDRPGESLAEAHRIASRVGLLEYIATGGAPVHAGGSRFPTHAGVRSLLHDAHWLIDHDAVVGLAAPGSWNNGIDADLAYDDASLAAEAEVVEAITDGAISAQLFIGSRDMSARIG